MRSRTGLGTVLLSAVLAGCAGHLPGPPAESLATRTAESSTTPAPTSGRPPTASASQRDAFEALAARPLQPPSMVAGECPVSPVAEISPLIAPASGTGPIRAVLGARAAHFDLSDNPITAFGRHQMKTLWLSLEPGDGRILVRVMLLDRHTLPPGFAAQDHASAPSDEGMPTQLRLGPEGAVSFGQPQEWRAWSSGTLVAGVGCYAFQMDRERGTETLVFEVVE